MKKLRTIIFVVLCILAINPAIEELRAGWVGLNSGMSTVNFNGVYFFNAATGIVVGSGGTILKTTDGGANWSQRSSGVTSDLNSINFISSSVGYIMGNGGVGLRTNDAGETWTIISTMGTTNNLMSVHFADQSWGMAVGANGTIKYTYNGGLGWYSPNSISPTTNAQFNSAYFVNNQTGLSVGTGGVIYRTTDGGISWLKVDVLNTNTLLDINFWNTQEGVATGADGKILKTTDAGLTWNTSIISGTTDYLYGIHSLANSNIGYAVGSMGRILITTNRGATWNSQCSGYTELFKAVYFCDQNTGYVVGANGLIIKTTDGGAGCIYIGNVTGSYCPGAVITVPYTITGTFQSNNVFTVQLSNSSGNFSGTWFSNVGTVQSANGGSVMVTIPQSAAAGGNYRMRIVSSNPVVTGGDNGSDITINSVPTPSITGSTQVCTLGSSVFSSNPPGGTICIWTISGGTPSTATGNSVSITWGAAGTGSVSLLQTNSTSCSASITQNVVIAPFPAPAISGKSSVCANSNENYLSNSPQNTTNLWSVNGGVISGSSTDNNVSIIWGSSPSGTLSLVQTNTSTGCMNSISRVVTINPLPTPVISGNNSSCEFSTERYSTVGVAGVSNSWTVTGGTISGSRTGLDVSVIWGATGSGLVRLDQTIQSTGCKNSSDYQVMLNPLPTPNITGNNSVCSSTIEQYSINSQTNVTSTWTVIGGTITSSNIGGSVNVQWGAAGAGSVKADLLNNVTGCRNSSTIGIVVNFLPTPAITGSSLVNANHTVTYSTSTATNLMNSWSVPSGGTAASSSTGSDFQVTWGGIGTGTVRLAQTNSSGCIAISNLNVNIISLVLSQPIGGEHWQAGSSRTITWAATPGLQYLKIEFKTEGNNYSVINDRVPANLGSYVWTVPNTISQTCRIRISSVENPTIYTESPADFIISNIAITSPTDNCCQFVTCADYEIKWIYSNVTNIQVGYSSSTAGPWTPANPPSIAASQGSYTFTLPQTFGSNRLYLKVSDAQNPSVYSVVTVPVIQPILSVSVPAEGAWLRAGSVDTIKWISKFIDNVKVEYSSNGGSFIEIANLPAIKGSTTWTVPATIGNNYLIRISNGNSNCPVIAYSSTFTVTDKYITINTPNGGEKFEIGSVHQIKWESNGINQETLEFSTNGGSSFQPITSPYIQGSKTCNWTIPEQPGTSCLIKIKDSAVDQVKDVTDSLFTIVGISLLYPTDNNIKVLVGSTQTLTWVSADVDKVTLKFSTDGGINWSTIATNYNARAGALTWKVPYIPSNNCLIKIIDTKKSNLNDVSQFPFTITGLLLTYPVGGESWLAASTRTIRWQSTNINKIKIEYSTDNGNNWMTVISSVDASLGSYSWKVEKNPSAQCKVKITAIEDKSFTDQSASNFSIMGDGILVTSPNINENWTIGDTKTISWSSANVVNVKIEYTLDNWVTSSILLDVSAPSNGSYDFVVSETPTTELRVRLTDADNPDISDESDGNNKISGTNYCFPPPSTWNVVRTADNATLVIPSIVDPKSLGSRDFQECDYIGAFFANGGKLMCAGKVAWQLSSGMALSIWGDNPRTTAKDGFALNEKYQFKAWDGTLGEEYFVYADYFAGFTDNYLIDNYSVAKSIIAYEKQNISLRQGWSMISSYLAPYNQKIETIMAPVKNSLDYVKNDTGQVYIPDPQNFVNSIQNWDVRNGYQVNMFTENTLQFLGFYNTSVTYSRQLQANKWYIVSNRNKDSRPIATAFSSIYSNLVMIKNTDGDVFYQYVPSSSTSSTTISSTSFTVDQIGQLMAGEGYKLLVNALSTLQYVAEASTFTQPSPVIQPNLPRPFKYIPEFTHTGVNAVLILHSEDLSDGDEIGVLDMNDNVVGSGVFLSGRAIITVWGDDPSTDYLTEGPKENDPLTIRIWAKGTQKEYLCEIHSIINALTQMEVTKLRFISDGAWIASVKKGVVLGIDGFPEPKQSIISQPNPTSGKTSFRYELSSDGEIEISIYNLMGEKVAEIEKGWMQAGIHTAVFDCSQLESGVYIFKLNTAHSQLTGKLMKIK
ncbi:MAG: hypothetical protein HW421_340 [Ignavibacteria bacterium]|nr:hypothetical protein [Ignavibacteria bacterium]